MSTRRLFLWLVLAGVMLNAAVGVTVGEPALPSPTADRSTLSDTARTTLLVGTLNETVEGEPDIDAFAPNNTVSPGQRTRFVVQLTNSGTVDDGDGNTPPEAAELVTTARNLRVTLDDDGAPIDVRTDTVALGDLPSGSITQAGFDIVVDEDADPGVYDLDVTVEYDYTASVSGDDRDDESETETLSVTLVVTENARFEVVDVESDLQVGEQGTVELTLENVGEESVENAAVTIRSRNADLLVDTGGETVRFVGDWDDGDEQTVTVQVTARNTSAPQEYALEAVVSYTDSDGVPRESFPLSFGVQPDEEQSFSLDDLEGDLRVGEDGTVTGTITNEGPGPVADAVVRLVDQNGDIVAQRSTAVLGDLDDGESADFSIPVRVAGNAKPGDRQLSLVVEYLNAEGDPRRSTPLRGTVGVEEKRDRFEVRAVEADVQAGAGGTVTVRIANVGDEDLTDATVILGSRDADLQLGSGGNASRFVGEWDAGDVKTVEVEANAATGTAGQRFPVTVSASFTDSDGDRRRSEPLVVGVAVGAEQRFAVRNVISALQAGESGTLSVTLEHTGNETLSEATVALRGLDPDVTPTGGESASRFVGDWAPGERRTLTYQVSVRRGATSASYPLELVASYTDADDNPRTSDPFVVGVTPTTGRRIIVRNEPPTLVGGDTGTIAVEVTNAGPGTATDVTVSLAAASPAILVEGGQTSTRSVGALPAGETGTATFGLLATDAATEGTYTLTATVTYDDPAGTSVTTQSVPLTVRVASDAEFAISEVTGSLNAGERGELSGAVVNTGEQPVRDAVLTVSSAPTGVQFTEQSYPLGDLEPGDEAPFVLPAVVPPETTAGVRSVSFVVEYETVGGTPRTSDPLRASAVVGPDRDAFTLRSLNESFPPDSTNRLLVRVTNAGDAPREDVVVALEATPPFTSVSPAAYVGTLEPGENATVAFELEVDEDAVNARSAVTFNVTSTTADGTTDVEGHIVPVTVAEEPTQIDVAPVVALVLLALAIVAGLGYWWYSQR